MTRLVATLVMLATAGLPCAAISVLTDECDPDNLQPVDIRDILETAAQAEKSLIVLIKGLLREI